MAIPVILKGETPKPIPLALKEGYDYSGCCLHVGFCGLCRTFCDLVPGGTVELDFSADETAMFPLGTSKVMLSLENANGEIRFMPWAKIKVTDSPADLYDGVITIDPATLDVDDLTAADSLGTVKDRLQAVISFLRALKVIALAALPFVACADVAPLYTTPNDMPGDAPLMTNVQEYVDAKVASIPEPDFSTSNDTLVATIEATAPAPGDYTTVSNRAMSALQSYTETDPTVPAWSKKKLSDMYANNLYQLLDRDFFAKDSSIQTPNKVYITGTSSTVTVGKGPTGSSYPYSVLGRNRFEVYGEDYNHVAHYRQEGVKVRPWWDDEAEDYATFLFPTNSNGGTFALTSDIPGETSNIVTKAYVEGLGISSEETDPTIGLTNGTIYVKGSTITPLTSHQSLSGYVPTSRTVNSKPLSSNVNLDASDVGAYSSADGTSLANIVNLWEGYWDGTNVIFEVTNYYGNTSSEIPRLRIKELREGVWQTVWDEANKFRVCETNIMSNVVAYVTGEVDGVKDYASGNFAPIAWGTVTDKGTTNVVGNSVWMTAPETYFAGGTEYQRVAVGSGMICVLTDNGALAKTTGEPGTFRFQDEGGTNYFGFAKSDSYTIGCNTDGITVEGTLVTLRYDVIMGGGDVPIVYWRQSLTSGEWVQLNNADGTATQGAPYTVTWYTSGGSYYAAINCGANASGFFKAETSVAGDVVFETNMKMRIDGGLSCPNTSTGVMGVIRPTFDGSTVIWNWSAK